MKIDSHKKRIKESIEVIEECIKKGAHERQRTIGFNISASCADMLEILLHKKDLIDPGFILKHEWLKSKNKIKEKLPFEFKNKNEILEILLKIEEKRNLLCYGSPQSVETIREVIEDFYKVKKIFREEGVNEF